MSRASVRKVFLTGLVVWIVGAVLAALSAKSGDQGGVSGLYATGLVLVGIGGIIDVISWILALVSSAVLGRWGWFLFTLILGIIGAVLIAMVIYSFFGPSTRRDRERAMVAS